MNIIHVDFHGTDVSFQNDGWFNATAVSARFNKEPTAWLRQRDTLDYLAALARRAGNSGFLTELNLINGLDSDSAASRTKVLALVKKSGFVRTRVGHPDSGGGTWMGPSLAVVFARWLDPDFGVWCDEQIRDIVAGKHEAFDWRRERSLAAISHKAMAATLKKVRQEAGKETAAHHYINESKLANAAALGEFKGVDRDKLSQEQLKHLADVELNNLIMIAQGKPYADRKAALLAPPAIEAPAKDGADGG